MPHSVIIPVTNVYAKGGFTAKVKVGSQGATANLILDSGSSTLVVQGEDYDPADDTQLQPTSLAQDITYGMGGWFGPVVQTKVAMGDGPFSVDIKDAHVAVTRKEQKGCFGDADGIFGLAYYELNPAYDLSEYLIENKVDPAKTYPWFLAQDEQDDTVRELKKFLSQYPSSHIKPYFTQLEEEGVVGNQFALLIHRSSIYQTSEKKPLQVLKHHPLNNGIFVMGHPRFHEHLYQGNFKQVKVLDDKYYNVNIKSMQVGNNEPIPAPQLEKKHQNYGTNGIVDTGASAIVLPKAFFDQMLSELIKINSTFESALEPYKTFDGVEKGIDINQINLEQWPDIHFTLEGIEGEDVTLTLQPENYWQTHAPEPGQISFQFVFLEKWPNQCILGLPLMTNHFTIFDRQQQDKGVILFAQKPG